MNLLLDTCTLIWLVNRDPQLSEAANKAVQGAWFVYVSAVTAWEMGIKAAMSKLDLGEPLETWFPHALEQHNLSEFSLSVSEAIRSARLPPIHADPADRLLMATAIEHNLVLLTPDPMIRRYPA